MCMQLSQNLCFVFFLVSVAVPGLGERCILHTHDDDAKSSFRLTPSCMCLISGKVSVILAGKACFACDARSYQSLPWEGVEGEPPKFSVRRHLMGKQGGGSELANRGHTVHDTFCEASGQARTDIVVVFWSCEHHPLAFSIAPSFGFSLTLHSKKVVAGACLILLIQVVLTLTSKDDWGQGTKNRMIELEQVRCLRRRRPSFVACVSAPLALN